MEIEIQITNEPIAEKNSAPQLLGAHGAWVEFRGVVRDKENGQKISALEYEAYPEMAEREIWRLLTEISQKNPCLAAKVIHRIGVIPVGETAIYIGIASAHRGEAFALLAEFMNRLKQDVPIWKRGARLWSQTQPQQVKTSKIAAAGASHTATLLSLDEALSEITTRCQLLSAVRVSLNEAVGRVLRETVCAKEDLPDNDRSTRDGYAILQNDSSENFQVVDTLYAADWKPRPLKTGETVRVATGATMPCDGLQVVMQEHVERVGDQIRIAKHETGLNLRRRGEDMHAGQPLVPAGSRLDAGKLALLATVGCAKPLVSPRLRVVHFTTGDELVPPNDTPKPGQIRDSNSILIRGLLEKFDGDVQQAHLPENFDAAKQLIATCNLQPATCNLLLISGGASVGDKDFTRPLLEWLGFEIIFDQVNVRPGRPLIFGVKENQIAFGLPGNPLAHFVCFHVFVAAALAKLIGETPKAFLRGKLVAKLENTSNPRETLWPARMTATGLQPLAWASSGDITCLIEANALIHLPSQCGSIETTAEVDFLPITDMFGA